MYAHHYHAAPPRRQVNQKKRIRSGDSIAIERILIQLHSESRFLRYANESVLDFHRFFDEIVNTQRFTADVAGQRHRVARRRNMRVSRFGYTKPDARAMPGRNASIFGDSG